MHKKQAKDACSRAFGSAAHANTATHPLNLLLGLTSGTPLYIVALSGWRTVGTKSLSARNLRQRRAVKSYADAGWLRCMAAHPALSDPPPPWPRFFTAFISSSLVFVFVYVHSTSAVG